MLLGIDLGTTNTKALVTDTAGRVLGEGSSPVRLFCLPDGGVEQDLEEIWQSTLAAVKQATAPITPDQIEAIGVSSQGGAMQLLDAEGMPVGPVISWLDQRGLGPGQALTEECGRDWFIQRIGAARSWLAVGQILRIRGKAPELLRSPNRVGFVGDSIVTRLSGRQAHDGTSAGLTLLYNPLRRQYDPELLARLGLDAAQLPDLLSGRTAAGGLSHEAALRTGLRAGIPVSPAVHDQYAAALACRVVENGQVMVGTGTAWVLLAVSNRIAAPVNDSSFVCHHLVDGVYGQILSLVNGGSAIGWALELLGLSGKSVAEVDALLEQAPAGSERLCFWPFLAPLDGSSSPQAAKGRLHGLQLGHGPAHLLRAVVEGLAFELKRHLTILDEAHLPVHRLVLSGGAASSRVTPQIVADVTGLPLTCSEASAASALGAAILARGLLEPQCSLAELARQMATSQPQVVPGKNAPLYQQRFAEYLRELPRIPPDSPVRTVPISAASI